MDQARKLLSLHSDFSSDMFLSMDELLRKMPFSAANLRSLILTNPFIGSELSPWPGLSVLRWVGWFVVDFVCLSQFLNSADILTTTLLSGRSLLSQLIGLSI